MNYSDSTQNLLITSNNEMLYLLEELLKEGKRVRLKIQGNSMWPFLRNELEQVELSSPLDEELKPGAVVLFKYRDGFVMHRIITRDGDHLILMGDNVYQSKEITTTDQVIGIVRKIIYPNGKELSTNSFKWKSKSKCLKLLKPVFRSYFLLLSIRRRIIAVFV